MSKVSVIIPVYNVEKYLRQCLDSIINQTLEDIEIICVNDCSPDNSLSILQEYTSKDNRIRIIDLKENGGPGNARNIAIKEVKSDYIMFLDPDDWLELNACELAYNQISKNKNDFVIFGAYKYEEKKDRKYEFHSYLNKFEGIFGLESANASDLKVPFFAHAQCCYKIFNKNFLNKNNIYFDCGRYEDQLFNAKIFTLATSFSVLNVPLYNYRIRLGSITQSSSSWKDCINSRIKTYEFIKTHQHKFLSFYIISAINMIIVMYKKLTKHNILDQKNFYIDMYNLFKEFDNNINISDFDKYLNKYEYNLVLNSKNYYSYFFRKYIIDNIFSVQESHGNIKICLFGIEIHLK